MFCLNCGYRLRDGAKFCPGCGSTVQNREQDPGITVGGEMQDDGSTIRILDKPVKKQKAANEPEYKQDNFDAFDDFDNTPYDYGTGGHKKKSKGGLIALIIILIVLILAGIGVGIFFLLGDKDSDDKDDEDVQIEDVIDEDGAGTGSAFAPDASVSGAESGTGNAAQGDLHAVPSFLGMSFAMAQSAAESCGMTVIQTEDYPTTDYAPGYVAFQSIEAGTMMPEGTQIVVSLAVEPSEGTVGTVGGTNSEYVLPYSDSMFYTEDDIWNFSQQELSYARNEIYARHGRMFKNEDLQAYFNSKSWYTPVYTPDEFDQLGGDSILNQYELANKNLIVEVEKAKGYR